MSLALLKLGADLSVGRRRRGITTVMMAERLGVARTTYDRFEHGDPKVAIGTYMMALFVLGLGTPVAELADPEPTKRARCSSRSSCQACPSEARAAAHVKRTRGVALGNSGRRVGLLRYNRDGARESASFEYDAEWLAAPDRFRIDPAS